VEADSGALGGRNDTRWNDRPNSGAPHVLDGTWIVAEVRAALGDRDFDAAAARGAAMSADEAIDFLLGELRRVRAASSTPTGARPDDARPADRERHASSMGVHRRSSPH
jgi:hypothetical protein